MYIPPNFLMDKPEEVLAFIRQYNFGILVSTDQTQAKPLPLATHLPFLVQYSEDELIIEGHLAKENPHALLG